MAEQNVVSFTPKNRVDTTSTVHHIVAITSVDLTGPSSANDLIVAWVQWYNTVRLHSSLGYVTPDEWEEFYIEDSVRHLAA